jgi:next-to-BRCA1 protein 1
VLQVPAGEKLILERYSDSAVRYVLLDSETPAVYKQLYRAAKAKLKLRIKATTRPKPEGTPLPGVAPALKAEQLLNETGQRYSYLDTVLSAPLSTTMSTSPSAGKAPGATPAASNVDMDIPIPSDFSLFEHRPRHFALGPEKRSYPLMFPAKESSNAAFCIDCNHCGASIPGEHYHCSICDEGDYDLCAVCVDAGITCPGEDHWLLKRLVQNGVIVNSTTETIAPRQPEPEVVVKAEGSTDESKEATEVKPEVKIESRTEEPVDENPEAVEERTCNACFKGKVKNRKECGLNTDERPEFAEAKMVTCDDCEDYDLCITCLLKDSHGHHPAHTLSLIEDHDFCLKNLVLLRCRPGRQYHHAAICDGCDQVCYRPLIFQHNPDLTRCQ